MIALTDADPWPRLRAQVDRFRADVEQAQSRLESLTNRDPIRFRTVHDPPVQTRSAQANLDRAEAGLRNAERLLREHGSLTDRRDDRPP